MSELSSEPATSAGETKAAGEDVSDDAAVAEVADQTSSDLKAKNVFERESDGASAERPASEVSADQLAD